MSEWWTYRPSSFLLFSARTYYRLFELYNGEIWPAQIVALLAGLAILVLLRKPGVWRGRVIVVLLAASWLWVAWEYLYSRYAAINWLATYFAAAFALEAFLLIGLGIVGRGFVWQAPARWVAWAGMGLVIFAVALHPLIAPLVGRPWSQVEIFAIAPDPTVVATLGVLDSHQRLAEMAASSNSASVVPCERCNYVGDAICRCRARCQLQRLWRSQL